MEETKLYYLFYRSVNDLATESERNELLYLMALPENEKEVNELIDEFYALPINLIDHDEQVGRVILNKIITDNKATQLKTNTLSPIKNVMIWLSGIAALLMVCFWIYTKNSNSNKTVIVSRVNKPKDVVAASQKAILTLGDGSKVVLNDVPKGSVTKQGNVEITKLADGKLVYKIASANADEKVYLNTISTPRGGFYQINLPDGTMAWLNAASSILFPTKFIGKERKVEITGEVYFEVAHNKMMPFKVKANGVDISVLGTHFNVMAYADENKVVTTLLEGAVKLNKNTQETILTPGNQAIVENGKADIEVKYANMEKEMAWKNGFFYFDNASLSEVLRQISRWYDVDIINYSTKNDQEFVGKMSRAYSLQKILKILQLSQIQLDVEGKKIIVNKQ